MHGLDHLENRNGLLVAPDVTARRIGFVHHPGDGRFRRQFKPQVHEPVQGLRGAAHGKRPEDRVYPAIGDALGVPVVLLRAVFYAQCGLLARARGADLAGRPVERPANARIGVDLQNAGAALGREDGRRQAGGTGADHDEIVFPAHLLSPAIFSSGLTRSMGSGNTIVELPSLATSVSVCR